MTKDEIIRMAREAGFDVEPYLLVDAKMDRLERFAALVAAHAKQEYIDSVYEQHRETMFSNKDLGMLVDAVKAEREACAKVCEELDLDWRDLESRIDCAAAIRARNNKE